MSEREQEIAAQLYEATAAVAAYALRPKSEWREREKWTPADHQAFNARIAAFDAAHDKPTPRQLELVEADYKRFIKGIPGQRQEMKSVVA